MRLLTFVLTVMTAFTMLGSTAADSVKVYFHVGHRQFDPSLGDNRAKMQRFVTQVREAEAAGNLESILVRAYASPDGLNKANQQLSVNRCNVIADYIAKHTGVNPELIKTQPGGIAWDELRQLVAADPDVPSREKIIDILDNTPVWVFNSQGKIIDSRKKQLMDLDKGVPYRWMLANLFPELRNAVAVSLFVITKSGNAAQSAKNGDSTQAAQAGKSGDGANAKASGLSGQSNLTDPTGLLGQSADQSVKNGESAKAADSTQAGDSAKTSHAANAAEEADAKAIGLTGQSDPTGINNPSDPTGINNPSDPSALAAQHRQSGSKPFYFAVKTNMLFDALLVPNIGAEFYLGKNLSVYGEWMHAWWSYNNHHRYYRIYGGDLGLRWWFGKKAHIKPLTGHHIGVYAGAFTFDMEFGNRGYMGGLPGGSILDRCFINGGLEYGYSLPVSRRLNIDFTIGIGYISGKYMEYIPDGFEHGYLWQQTKRFGWFGPTKAEVSLVWLIGRGNVNAKKGGEK